ncbi:MAG: NAD(P)/FAD-dependent oxidoreductase, partial [Candidatus Rokuibacteriota bacterium]
LFTHFGFSGPAGLDISRHWHRAPSADRGIYASFLPDSPLEELLSHWRRITAEAPGQNVRQFVGDRADTARLPARLLERLCEETAVAPTEAISQVSRERRARLLASLTHRPLHVGGTLGFEKAECTAGGVRLAEVDPSTLESRLVPGLYLGGEILDVEGRLGGFNFQWAWSSGTVAGRAAASA